MTQLQREDRRLIAQIAAQGGREMTALDEAGKDTSSRGDFATRRPTRRNAGGAEDPLRSCARIVTMSPH